jgi:peptide/nickel transport system permease protein
MVASQKQVRRKSVAAKLAATLSALVKKRGGLLGLALVLGMIGTALASFEVPQSLPLAIDTHVALQGPTYSHPLGTDYLGRDMLSRVVFGARISLYVGLLSTALGTVLGSMLGLVSGYYGGKLDEALMRVSDITLAFPNLIFAILIVIIAGRSLEAVILAVGIPLVPIFARVARGTVLSLREKEFVDAVRVLGYGNARILFLHIAPSCLSPIIAATTISVGGAIEAEAALGFLGLGIAPPTPDWGADIMTNFSYLFEDPWAALIPGLMILIIVLGLNLLGDDLRDLLDPRLRST